MKRLKFLVSLILVTLTTAGVFGQNRPEHELHSMMIYNFLKYVQWPEGQNSGDFVIGVIGDDDVYNTLAQWYHEKQRGDKKFLIKKFNSLAEITDTQILYIGSSASKSFGMIQDKVGNSATLTITNKNGLGKDGSCINFTVVDNRLKFELNTASLERAHLKASSQLSAMAIII